jgi:hypothetical protein
MRSAPLIAAVQLLFALALVACGGNGGDRDVESTANSGGASVSTNEAECKGSGPSGVRSTSHQVGLASSDPVIAMKWERYSGSAGYISGFTRDRDSAPDPVAALSAGDVEVASNALDNGEWFFYLSTERADGGPDEVITCGPYVIDYEGGVGSGAAGGTAGTVTLTISVSGGSSVEYHTNAGERLVCGDTSLSGHAVQCSADFVVGSEAAIQRTFSLPDAEEARWRLSVWGGDCAGIDADIEIRGGHCRLLMDGDKQVTVEFESRAMLTVSHQSPDQMSIRWELDYQPADQKGGGNPLTRRGTFDCRFPGGPPCVIEAMYDVGTEITVRAGVGSNAANFQGWGGACASFGTTGTCTFILTGDTTVTGDWAY